jgi:hypothetical protein
MSKVLFSWLMAWGFSVFTGWAQSNALLSARLVNVPAHVEGVSAAKAWRMTTNETDRYFHPTRR